MTQTHSSHNHYYYYCRHKNATNTITINATTAATTQVDLLIDKKWNSFYNAIATRDSD